MSTDLLNCYNKGCGKQYKESENSKEACNFHPGGPIFHDALKGWSCCKKRSTDFTEFLNIPGCTKGFHSNVKPVVQKEEKKNDSSVKEPEVNPVPIKPLEKKKRPSSSETLTALPVSVAESLKTAIEKDKNEQKEEKKEQEEVVTIGTSCKNNGCRASYEGEHSNNETCVYHTGVPVFHEGMKYWSCCEQKTTDFDSFLNQKGCTSGSHLWIKKEKEGEENKHLTSSSSSSTCRMDWHQTPGFVTISIFSKLSLPDLSTFEVNKVTCKVKVVFDKGGQCVYEKIFNLRGIIDISKSNVKMLGTKVEINLKKDEPGSWASLEVPPPS